jgi:hypothetical protein
VPWSTEIGAAARPDGTPKRMTWRHPAVLLAVGPLVVALAAVVAVRTTDGRTPVTTPVTTPYLVYAAPPGWSSAPPDAAAPMDAPTLVGIVHGPRYTCGGEEFLRGFAAVTLLPTDATAGAGNRAERVARWFAATAYSAADGTPPDITVAPPRPVRVAGPVAAVEGTVTETTVRAPGGRSVCTATTGRVLVLAVPHGGEVALLLVAADTAGGPDAPAAPDASALDAVVTSARLPTP